MRIPPRNASARIRQDVVTNMIYGQLQNPYSEHKNNELKGKKLTKSCIAFHVADPFPPLLFLLPI
jgi:hypothetical protein